MAYRVRARMRRRRARRDDNPRGYIKRRGRWIAAVPYFRFGRVAPMRRRRYDDNPRRRRRVRHDDNPRGYIKYGSRWRKITDYARRTRRGRFRNFTFPRAWKPLYPRIAANPRRRYDDNPRRRRSRRRLYDNPVAAVTSVFEEAFSPDSLELVFHTGLGFGGTLVGSRLVYKQLITGLDTPVGRVGTHLLGSIASGLLFGTVGGTVLGARALTGGLLATLWQAVSEAVRGSKAQDWVPTLGESPEEEAFRKAIEQEVLRELKSGGVSEYLAPAGSEMYLPPAGSEAYLTEKEATEGSMGAYLTENEAMKTVVGIGSHEFGPSTSERF